MDYVGGGRSREFGGILSLENLDKDHFWFILRA